MKMTVLVENNTESYLCEGQHGLSLHVQVGDKNILFDVGQDDLFLINAKKLGISIADVDVMALSHGHFDHGGGLACFLRHNRHAKVYLHDLAFGEHYSRASDPPRYIGLERGLEDSARFVRNMGYLRIDDALELFALPPGEGGFRTKGNATLAVKRDGEYVQDTFVHEHSLLITERNKRHLVAGCSHGGIARIVERAEQLCGAHVDNVIAGFHLYNSGTKQTESKELIHELANELLKTKAVYYTGHCTGKMGFAMLRELMGDQVRAISTGDVWEL